MVEKEEHCPATTVLAAPVDNLNPMMIPEPMTLHNKTNLQKQAPSLEQQDDSTLQGSSQAKTTTNDVEEKSETANTNEVSYQVRQHPQSNSRGRRLFVLNW